MYFIKRLNLDRGSIGTSPKYGIGSTPKKYKDTSSTLIDTCLFPLLKVMVVDNLLLDHVELPYAMSLISLSPGQSGWLKGKEDNFKTF